GSLHWTQTFQLDGEHYDWETYDTPLRAGGMRVVAANGLRLTLHADNGQQFIFDVATRKWLPFAPGQHLYPTMQPPDRTSVCNFADAGPAEATCVAQHIQTVAAQDTVLALTPTYTPLPPTPTLTPEPATSLPI